MEECTERVETVCKKLRAEIENQTSIAKIVSEDNLFTVLAMMDKYTTCPGVVIPDCAKIFVEWSKASKTCQKSSKSRISSKSCSIIFTKPNRGPSKSTCQACLHKRSDFKQRVKNKTHKSTSTLSKEVKVTTF